MIYCQVWIELLRLINYFFHHCYMSSLHSNSFKTPLDKQQQRKASQSSWSHGNLSEKLKIGKAVNDWKETQSDHFKLQFQTEIISVIHREINFQLGLCHQNSFQLSFYKQFPTLSNPRQVIICSGTSVPAGGAGYRPHTTAAWNPSLSHCSPPDKVGWKQRRNRAPSYSNRDSVSITSLSPPLSDSMTSDECNLHFPIWHITEQLPRTTQPFRGRRH